MAGNYYLIIYERRVPASAMSLLYGDCMMLQQEEFSKLLKKINK